MKPLRCVPLALSLALVLAGCGSRPVAPAWQLEAHDSLVRYQQAWPTGAAPHAPAVMKAS